jgi:hypothetical protein
LDVVVVLLIKTHSLYMIKVFIRVNFYKKNLLYLEYIAKKVEKSIYSK